MAGGDTTASGAAAFKNVPRRQRSAARPTTKEELGCDVSSALQPPPAVAAVPSPACNKKRTSPECGGPEERVHRRPEKRHRLFPMEEAKNGGGGGATPAPSRKDEAPAAAASASSSRERELPVDDWAEKERIRKGKMPAVNASPPQMTAFNDGGGKLLGDAIRSYRGLEIKHRISKPKPKSKKRKDRDSGPPFWCGMGRDRQATSSAGSDLASTSSFHNLCGGVISAALHVALAGATNPERVYGKMLAACDRNSHQSRLQMSCKSWLRRGAAFPLDAFLTAPEKKKAHGGEGLMVTAYDRRGEVYDITVKYLGSNRSYRLTKQWGKFLTDNGLVVDVVPGPKDVVFDMWMFRTLEGEVGMVVMHYFKGDAPHADAAFDEEEARAQRLLLDNDVAMDDVAASGADDKGQLVDDAGVKGDVAATPSPPEPDGGKEEQAGGAASEVVVVAGLEALSPDADGTKEEKEDQAGGALTTTEAAAQSSSLETGAAAEAVKEEAAAGAPPGEADGKAAEEKEAASAATTEAAAQPSSSKDVVSEAKAAGKEAAAEGKQPSLPDAGGGAKKASGAAALSSRFGLNKYEMSAAYALVLLSMGLV